MLLQASEIRIGNKFYLPKGKKEITVSGIEQLKSKVFIHSPDWHMAISLHEMKGIPMSQEILSTRLNFNKGMIGYFKNIDAEREISIDWNDVGRWYVYLRQRNYDDNGNFMHHTEDDFTLMRRDLAFLHELQNIWVDLTKQEFKINA